MTNQRKTLSKDDKAIILKKLKKQTVIFLTILITIVSIYYYTIYTSQKTNGIYFDFLLKLSTITTPIVLLYLFLGKNIFSLLRDLYVGSKLETETTIIDKIAGVNTGSANINQKTSLTEYHLFFDDYHLLIDEGEYSGFEVGDQIKVYTAKYSDYVLGIDKNKTNI